MVLACYEFYHAPVSRLGHEPGEIAGQKSQHSVFEFGGDHNELRCSLDFPHQWLQNWVSLLLVFVKLAPFEQFGEDVNILYSYVHSPSPKWGVHMSGVAREEYVSFS